MSLCSDCKGKGVRPARFLGQPAEFCDTCAGTGQVAVRQDQVSAWQQEVLALLMRIAAAVEEELLLRKIARAEQKLPVDLKPIDFFEEVNP